MREREREREREGERFKEAKRVDKIYKTVEREKTKQIKSIRIKKRMGSKGS